MSFHNGSNVLSRFFDSETIPMQPSGKYSLLHLECHLISISNLNLLGVCATERGK